MFYFVGIDGARFKRPVGPGDQLRLEVEIMRFAKSISKFRGVATVDGAVAAEAELMCTLREVGPPQTGAAAAGARAPEAGG